MKKFVFIFVALCSNVAFADYYKVTVPNCDESQMRAALDRAAAERGSVVTVVECEDSEEETTTVTTSQTYTQTWGDAYEAPRYPCESQLKPMSAVVNREYFVRETVQQYRPVVKYVPAGTYVRVRPVCNHCGY